MNNVGVSEKRLRLIYATELLISSGYGDIKLGALGKAAGRIEQLSPFVFQILTCPTVSSRENNIEGWEVGTRWVLKDSHRDLTVLELLEELTT